MMKKKLDNKIIGYINVRIIDFSLVRNFDIGGNKYRNFIYNIGGFWSILQFEKFLENISTYLFLDGQYPVFIDDGGELRIHYNMLIDCVIGKDYRSIYAPYNRKLVKIGIITEWNKYPFIKKSNALSEYKSLTKLISEKEKEIYDLKAQRSYIISCKRLSKIWRENEI